MANGSISELETQVLIAERLNLITVDISEQLQKQINSVGRLLSAVKS
ncbi:MAG: four helix bundle protein [Treponema sp.]|nr:four helix bundle protein [Treponema sp.]